MVNIRVATEADIAGIRAVGAATWRDTYTDLVPDGYIEAGLAQSWTHDHFAQSLANPAYRVHVAAEDGRVVGVAQATRDTAGVGHLWRLYLLREARGRGVGRALWATTIASFAPSPARWETSVIAGNPALTFYERLGFRVVGQGTWSAYGYGVPLIYLALGAATPEGGDRWLVARSCPSTTLRATPPPRTRCGRA